jgi:hypothetical protein
MAQGSHLGAAVVACAILATIGVQAGVRASSSRPSAAAESGSDWMPPDLTGGARPAVSGPASELDGVYCTSAANCWADGYLTSGTVTLGEMLHWNGRRWRVVPVPNPAGSRPHDMNELSAVRCLNARDCWAVGLDSPGDKAEYGAALHWNGRTWLSVATPEPGGSKPADVTQINDSACTAADSCWAVGDYGTRGGGTALTRNLVLQWNGTQWSQVLVPNPDGSEPGHYNALNAVRCPSTTQCLADGGVGVPPDADGLLPNARDETLLRNGGEWSQLVTPDPVATPTGAGSRLVTLACGSPGSCWGGGYYGASAPRLTTENQILRWHGTKWTKAETPDSGGTTARAINYVIGSACSSARNCWAVGTYENTAQADVNQALHWNGSDWSLVTTPDPAGLGKSAVNVLISVSCTSAATCWAVGAVKKPSGHIENEILYRNGTSWSVR